MIRKKDLQRLLDKAEADEVQHWSKDDDYEKNLRKLIREGREESIYPSPKDRKFEALKNLKKGIQKLIE